MKPRFDLIDEGWIPCIIRGPEPLAQRRRALGICETLERAHEIQEVSDPSPLVTAALHRLLIAIAHRVASGPRNVEQWATLWDRARFDPVALEPNLTAMRPRCDLFDERRPFYQVASIGEEYGQTIAKLTHELSSGNNATLFDHTSEARVPVFTPARAACYLVAAQSYAVCGLLSYEKGQDPKLYKSATAAPLVKGALVLVRGKNLFETILLNMPAYHPAQGLPFKAQGADLLAWERDEETRVEARPPDGYLDMLTWQSRRIRLFPEVLADGGTVVRRVAIMKGYIFPSEDRHIYETMAAFRENPKATAGQEPFPAVGFRAERALWRDSLALMQTSAEQPRPRTLTWLHTLEREEALRRRPIVPLDALGMLTDQASVVLWRHERLPLPLVYLDPDKGDLVAAMDEALRVAEAVASALAIAGEKLALLLLAPAADQPNARKPLQADIRNLASSFGLERAYWPTLEPRFRALLVALPDDTRDDAGVTAYGGTQLPFWIEHVRRAAWGTFTAATEGLDSSARSLKAVAKARGSLGTGIARALKNDGTASTQKKGTVA